MKNFKIILQGSIIFDWKMYRFIDHIGPDIMQR